MRLKVGKATLDLGKLRKDGCRAASDGDILEWHEPKAQSAHHVRLLKRVDITTASRRSATGLMKR